MERIGGEDTGMPTSIRKVVVASFIGTTIEWYDYFIFATAAALFFPDVFFPGFGETMGTILAYTTFAVGFGARPLGGLIFGHYGDKIGRKTMLVTTILIMGIATFLVGRPSELRRDRRPGADPARVAARPSGHRSRRRVGRGHPHGGRALPR